jgi:hypothetical protein
VVDIDDDTKLDQLEVVLGVGLSVALSNKGYLPVTTKEVIQATLAEQVIYNPMRMVVDVLPRLLKSGKWIPVHRWLAAAGYQEEGGMLRLDGIDERVIEAAQRTWGDFSESNPYSYVADRLQTEYNDLATFTAGLDDAKSLHHLLLIDPSRIEPTQLREYLLEKQYLLESPKHASNYRKLCTYYDKLAFGP